MAEGIRLVSVRRGVDPRRFALLAFGGAAGLHVTEVARMLEIRRVVVPRVAAVLSAWGMLATDLRYELVRTHVGEAGRLGAARLRAALRRAGGARAAQRLGAAFAGAGARPALASTCATASRSSRSACRSTASTWRRRTSWRRSPTRFHRRHEELYTYSAPGQEVVLVNARVAVVGALPGPARRADAVARRRRPRRREPARVSGSAAGTRCRSTTLDALPAGPGGQGPGHLRVGDHDRADPRGRARRSPRTAGSTSRSRAHADPDCVLRRDLLGHSRPQPAG